MEIFANWQSRTQSPQALWPAVGRQERLWGTVRFIHHCFHVVVYISAVTNFQ